MTKYSSYHSKYLLIILIISIFFTLMNYQGMKNSGSVKEMTYEKNESFDIKAYMCQVDDCEQVYEDAIIEAKRSLYCAFFEFNLEGLHETITNKDITKLIYVDGENAHFNDTYIIYENKSSYMHNKFCIIDDEILITGSFNPTINDKDKNDNNVVVIKSKDIAETYDKYFVELLKEYNSGYKYRSKLPKNYNFELNGTNVSICFSRGGNCLSVIYNEIARANYSVESMLFTMSDDDITNIMLAKSYEGANIEAIFEKSLITNYSSYHKLSYQLDGVKKDCNKGKLHHKVFIIDNRTVITGSFNPSNNAEKNNDENMIIISNDGIANKFIEEWHRISGLCETS